MTTNTSTQTEESTEEPICVDGEEHHLIRKIEENGKMLQELKVLIEGQKENMEGPTYARVVASKHNTKSLMERGALHSVVISSMNEQDTGEEVLEKVRKAVNAKEGWVAVEKIRKAKDRKIVMGCKTKEEREKVKEKLERAGVHLLVEEMENKNPLLILKDVLAVHSDEDVLRALKNQNREVFHGLDKQEDKMTVKYRKRTRNPHTSHIVISVSPVIWKRATGIGRVRVDLQHVYVEDQSPLVQCSRCLGYGHGRRFCKDTQDLCSHCGGLHLRLTCPDLIIGEPAECVNCKKAKLDSRAHNAFSRECPVRIKWDNIARASTSYC